MLKVQELPLDDRENIWIYYAFQIYIFLILIGNKAN